MVASSFPLNCLVSHVTVGLVERPDVVWVSQDLVREQLMEEMEGLQLVQLTCPVEVGTRAAAVYSEDGRVYRCEVVEMVDEEDKMLVRYIDYGNVEIKGKEELLALPPSLAVREALAVRVMVPWARGVVDSDNNRIRVERKLLVEGLDVVIEKEAVTDLLLATFSIKGKVLKLSKHKESSAPTSRYNEAEQKLLERTSKYLRSTLLSQKGGVEMTKLSRDYRGMVGEEIPYKRLNFPSLETFLWSLPGVCRVNCGLVTAVVSEATAHIGDMVARQNMAKGKGGRSGGGGRRFDRCSRVVGGFSGRKDDFDPFGCGDFDVVGTSTGLIPAGYEDCEPPEPVRTSQQSSPGNEANKDCEPPEPVLTTRQSSPGNEANKDCEPPEPVPSLQQLLSTSAVPASGVNCLSEEVEGRVRNLLQGRKFGLYLTQLEKMYIKQHGDSLSADWAKQMAEVGCLKIENNMCTLVIQDSVPAPLEPVNN